MHRPTNLPSTIHIMGPTSIIISNRRTASKFSRSNRRFRRQNGRRHHSRQQRATLNNRQPVISRVTNTYKRSRYRSLSSRQRRRTRASNKRIPTRRPNRSKSNSTTEPCKGNYTTIIYQLQGRRHTEAINHRFTKHVNVTPIHQIDSTPCSVGKAQ